MDQKHIPLSLHEKAIERHFKKDVDGKLVSDPALDAMLDAMLAGRKAALAIVDAHDKHMRNQMLPTIANARRSRENAFSVFERVAKQFDSASARANAELKDIEAKISPQRPRDAVTMMSYMEFRSALASLSPDKRQAAINEAIETGDDALVAAVLTGHPALTGIAKTERDLVQANWRRKRFPDELDRMARIDKALDDLHRAGIALRGFCDGLTDANAVAAAEASERAAAEASKVSA